MLLQRILYLLSPILIQSHSIENAIEKLTSNQLESGPPVPIVIWHGINDNYEGWGIIPELFRKNIPGVYIKQICIGNNSSATCGPHEDKIRSWYGDAAEQIDQACEKILQDSELTTPNGFNVLGISQGGLLSRVLVQRCQKANIRVFTSFGGPQAGVNAIPGCDVDMARDFCENIRLILNLGIYAPIVQQHILPAQYWRDPIHPKHYYEKSAFLPDANQDFIVVDEEVEKIKSLEAMVLVKFNQDLSVVPPDSEWFGYYENGQDSVVLPAQDWPVWENLGLSYLSDNGKLHFLSKDGHHLEFTTEWFEENIVPFFQN